MTNSSSAAAAVARPAIDRIKAEHRTLGRVLGAMQALVAGYRDPTARPDFELFYSMLRYIENVPDRLHHPKEDRSLFSAVVARGPACSGLVNQLEADHAKGAPLLTSLRGALDSFCAGEPNSLNHLATAVDEFVEFYWTHMRREETELLPLALAFLTDEDWKKVDATFATDTDPLSGRDHAAEYRRLYDRIVEMTPRPLKTYLESEEAA